MPMTTSTESASMYIALAPCPETTWSGPVRTKHGRTVMGHARGDRAVRLLHQASSSDWAGAGSSRRTSPVQDTRRVSHSQGHARSYQFQPGIITEPLSSLTVILAVIPPGPTAANQTTRNGMPSQPDLARPCWGRSERKIGSYLLNSGGLDD